METPTATKGKFVVLDMGPKSVRAAAFTQSDTKFSCTETLLHLPNCKDLLPNLLRDFCKDSTKVGLLIRDPGVRLQTIPADILRGDEPTVVASKLLQQLKLSDPAHKFHALDVADGGVLKPASQTALVVASNADAFDPYLEITNEAGLQLDWIQSYSAARLGALQEAQLLQLNEPLFLVDCFEQATSVASFSKGAYQTLTAEGGLNLLYAAIQNELNLKFAGSAVKLLYDGIYDFSEIAEALGKALAQPVEPLLADLKLRLGASGGLLIQSAFGPERSWLVSVLERALALKSPDSANALSLYQNKVDLSAVAEKVDLTWLPLLKAVNDFSTPVNPWLLNLAIEWPGYQAPKPATVTATAVTVIKPKVEPVVLPPTPAGPVDPAPTPAPVPEPVVTPEPKKETLPAEKPKVAKAIAVKAKPKPQLKQQATQGNKTPVPPKKIPVDPAPEVQKPTHGEPVTPPPAKPPQAEEKKSKPVLIIALVAAVLVIGGILFVFMSSDKEPGTTADVAAQPAVPAPVAPPPPPEPEPEPEPEPIELKTAGAVAPQPEPEVEPVPEPLPEPEPVITTGSLKLESEPQGAEVWIASTLRGTTPLSLEDLEQGEYVFELRKPGFVTLQGTFEIVAEQETVLQGLKLNPELGALLIASNLDNVSVVITALESEATVYEGYLPLELDSLRPGRYRAVAEKEGWSAIELDISVQPKTASKYRMDFPLASVRVTSQPAGAKVYHGIIDLGITPLTLEGLPPGEHLFSLELAGYEPMEVSFKLDPDTLLEPPAIELLSWDRIVPGGQVHTLPAILEQTNPVPPVRNREEVRVVVRAIVNVDGTLSDLTVVSSDNNNFNNAALRALANWRFEPATRHDRPVRTQINIPLVFPAS